MFAFLKIYKINEAAASIFGVTKKTRLKWVWIMLAATQSIKRRVISEHCKLLLCLTFSPSLFVIFGSPLAYAQR